MGPRSSLGVYRGLDARQIQSLERSRLANGVDALAGLQYFRGKTVRKYAHDCNAGSHSTEVQPLFPVKTFPGGGLFSGIQVFWTKKAARRRLFLLNKVAKRTGLEPATSSVTGWRSNRTELPLHDLGCRPCLAAGTWRLYRRSRRNARQEIIFSCMRGFLAGRNRLNNRTDLKSVNDMN